MLPTLVGVVPIEQDGSLGAHTDVQQLQGEPGPNRNEQASSHPHNAVFNSSGRFNALPDKGLERFFVFQLDGSSGKLVPNGPQFVATRAGQRPRHIAFHPSLPLAYVVNELGTSVTTYRSDPERGNLPVGWEQPGQPKDSETVQFITLDPAARVLDAASIESDTIVPFATDWRSGIPAPTGHIHRRQ